jgi:hypothetical protein
MKKRILNFHFSVFEPMGDAAENKQGCGGLYKFLSSGSTKLKNLRLEGTKIHGINFEKLLPELRYLMLEQCSLHGNAWPAKLITFGAKNCDVVEFTHAMPSLANILLKKNDVVAGLHHLEGSTLHCVSIYSIRSTDMKWLHGQKHIRRLLLSANYALTDGIFLYRLNLVEFALGKTHHVTSKIWSVLLRIMYNNYLQFDLGDVAFELAAVMISRNFSGSEDIPLFQDL